MRTLIKNGTVLAWNQGMHEPVAPCDVVYEGATIVHVGPGYEGSCDDTIDARDRLVVPGFVNSHLHATELLYCKGYLEEVSNVSANAKATNYGTLYHALPAIRNAIDPDAQAVSAECSFAELLRTGSTTIVEMGFDAEIGNDGDIRHTERVAEIAARMGLRCYMAPRFRTQHYGAAPGAAVWYQDYPDKGWERFEACVDFCDRWNGRFDDRLRTMLAPGQVDTCAPELLRATRKAADELRVPIHIHAGQSPNEFETIKARHGMTTVEYMMDTQLLGPDFIIGHGQVLTQDGDLSKLPPHEVSAIRESRTTVAHLPWVKARRGGVINSIHKYKLMGIRQCLGTDTYPLDMFNEMRTAAVVCRVVERSASVALARDVFDMATVGGADALGRPDLGRLAPGCKADIVLVHTDSLKANPLYDPFNFLVFAASGDDVDTVIIDGNTVVKDGEVRTLDIQSANRRANEAAGRVRANIRW